MPWRKAVGAALTTAAMLALGLAIGHWQYGVWAFMGAFTSIYVAPEPYRKRAAVLAAVAIGLAAALALASLAANSWWMTALALGIVGLGSTFVTGAFRIPLPGSLMFILIACIAAALPADPKQTPLRVAFVLLGGAAAWVQGMLGWFFHPHRPEANTVHSAYEAIAKYFAAIGTTESVVKQHQAALALELAEDATTPLRSHWNHDRAEYRLVWLTDQAEDLFRAVTGLATATSESSPQAWVHYLQALADDLVARTELPPAPTTPDPSPEWERLSREAEKVREALAQSLPAVREVRGPALPSSSRTLSEAWTERSAVRVASLRMGLGLIVATLIAHLLGQAHPYWAPLTVGAILQGTTPMTMVWRSIQRVLGTIAGLALAGALMAIAPTSLGFLVMVVLLQFWMLVLIVRNYGVSVAMITAMALVIIASEIHPTLWPMIWARFIETLVGWAIALVLLRWVFTHSSSDQLASVLNDTVDKAGELLDAILGQAPNKQLRLRRARADAAVLHLRTTYDRAINELGSHPEVGALWPAVVSSQRLTYAIAAIDERTPRLVLDSTVRHEAHHVFESLSNLLDSSDAEPVSTIAVPNLPHLGAVSRELRNLAEALQQNHQAHQIDQKQVH